MIISVVSHNKIIWISLVLIVQYFLAIFTLMKLFKNKPNKLNSIIWNLIIVLIIILGPILYLIIERPNNKQNKSVKKTKDNTVRDYENTDYLI